MRYVEHTEDENAGCIVWRGLNAITQYSPCYCCCSRRSWRFATQMKGTALHGMVQRSHLSSTAMFLVYLQLSTRTALVSPRRKTPSCRWHKMPYRGSIFAWYADIFTMCCKTFSLCSMDERARGRLFQKPAVAGLY